MSRSRKRIVSMLLLFFMLTTSLFPAAIWPAATVHAQSEEPGSETVAASVYESVYDGLVTLKSSNTLLEDNFKWATGQALEFVQTGKTGPVNVNKTGGQPGPFTYIPSYWAGYKHRTAFYSRDFVHQAPGASILGLHNENFSMFQTFAKGMTEARKWYTLWAYNFDASNYTIDWRSDTNFVREVPAQFELVEKAYKQYLWTGNDDYINDPYLWDFYTKTVTDFITLHDTNGNGVAEGTGGGIFSGAVSYNERSDEKIIEAGDAIGSQYQAFLAYAHMLEAKGSSAEAANYFAKAQQLKDYFNNEWSIKDGDKAGSYARALGIDGQTKYAGFGKENSWFMPMKLITEPGQRNSNYLDYISGEIGNGLLYDSPTTKARLDKPNSPSNVEAYTYLPDTFYPYNRVNEGWKWLEFLMETRPNKHEQFNAGTLTNGEYPEISYTIIGNVIEGLMGIEPNAPKHAVATAPRLSSEVPDVKVDFLKIGANELSVSHTGNTKTELANKEGTQPLTWEARFYGNFPTITLNGTDMPALHKTVNGVKVSYITTSVDVGATAQAEASTAGTADKAEVPSSDRAAGTYDTTIAATLSTPTANAKIYYTLDGTTPTRDSNLYTGPFIIQKSATLKLITASDTILDSDVASYDYTINAPIVEKPMSSKEAATYSAPFSMTLSTATAGADIYYTTDGKTPTKSTTKYVNPIAIAQTTTVKAIAYKNDWVDSDVVVYDYAIVLPVTSTPTASKAAGRYDEAFQVTLATETVGASVYYTTNGDTPTINSTRYTGAIDITQSTTVKAIAMKDLYTNSGVASYSYRIVSGPLADPASATVYLSDLDWVSATTGWAGHPPLKDHAIKDANTPIKINGKTYAKGIGANATSIIKYNIGGGYGTFKAVIGIDDVQNKKGTATTLWFEVLGDGFSIYKSPTFNTVNGPATGIPIELDIVGVNELTLVLNDAGTPASNPSNSDHGDWADAKIIPRGAVASVALNKPTVALSVYGTEQLISTVSPSDATNQTVTWTSSEPLIATVDETGIVTAVSPGMATITVTAQDGGVTATSTVTVSQAVTGVTLSETSLNLVKGEQSTLLATIAPADATNKGVEWSTSDPAIATVSSTGEVTAVALGKATITATTKDGGFKAATTVTVTGPQVRLKSSNALLQENFQWAIGQALSFVQTGKSGPVNVSKGGGQPGPFEYIPSYWAGYKHRTAFYSRDFVHQAPGASILRLHNENYSMFQTFAKGMTEARKWYTLWAYNFDASNYTIDWKSDTNFVREVPAQFELVEKAYKQYLWTGNEDYLNDPFLWEFYTKVVTDFITLHDTNGNGVAEGTGGGIFSGAVSYNERSDEKIIEAGDAIGSQYQAFLAYAHMLEAKGSSAEAANYFAKAQQLKDYFNNEWSIKDGDKAGSYARALGIDGQTKYAGFGKENSWFMPMKLITEPGQRNSNYLDYISGQIGNGLLYDSPTTKARLDKPNSPSNIEAYSYLPDTFYPYNRVNEGWKWLKFLMETRPNKHEQFNAGTLTNGEYPEISYTIIGNVVEGLMGIDPNAPKHAVATAPRLSSEVPDVKVDYLRIGENETSVAHTGNTKTVFENKTGTGPITWEARFYGNFPTIKLNGTDTPALYKTVNGVKVSYITTSVAVGTSIEAEAVATGTADKAAAPSSDKASGTYVTTISVALASQTADTKVYYTLDGTTPTRDSKLYTGPFIIQKSATLKAIAASETILDSDIASYDYTINAPIVAMPIANVEAGLHDKFLTVALSTASADAEIHYTIDGKTPTKNSTKYVNPIQITKTTTVKAIAFKERWTDSDLATYAYEIVLPKAADPTASMPVGRYDEPFQITLETATAGTAIYYTTNGDKPTKDSTLYTGAIDITKSTWLKAVAIKDEHYDSNITSFVYHINGTLPVPASKEAYLSDLDWVSAESGWKGHPPLRDHTISNAATPIKINGKTYAKGIGTHATSTIVINIGGGYSKFKSVVGIDDVKNTPTSASSVWFEVLGDGVSLYKSPTLEVANGVPAQGIPIEVDVTGVYELTLYVSDAGSPASNPTNSDHADWADALLIPRVDVVRATGVTVSKTSLDLTTGAKSTLAATIVPENATNPEVEWSTSNAAVATVSSTGEVTAVAPGTATITVTTKDGEFKATTKVTVSAPSTSGPGPSGPSEPTKPVEPPVVNPQGSIKLEPKTDANGKANVVLSEKDILSAGHSSNKTVSIEVKTEAGTKDIAVSVPVAKLQSGTTLAIDTGFANVSIAPELLVHEDGRAAAALDLSVSLIDKATLPASVQTIIGQNEVFDFNLTIDGKKQSDFGSNRIDIALPYQLKDGENANHIVVYYINDKGELEIVKNGRFNPETGSVEFSAKHFSKYAIATVNVSFSDTSSVAWAKDAIEALAARQAINGIGEGKFNPNGRVTRAEFIAMLVRTFDLQSDNPTTSLKDVAPGAWYYEAVASAQQLGIVKGKADGSFGINDQITRQEMAVMVYRAASLVGEPLTPDSASEGFSDQKEISAFALEAVSAMQKEGLIKGLDNNKYAPLSHSTRAQAATIIHRLYMLVK
ncbi:chitobiase/beta-hexosaminidase C-terminal domain-containing protein [Paenibacillus sp. PL91]|uniref:chitobiase/beta-hexosaminidase C-terminal domain-containing protein n=1 Tax=Paenibacillus sp. PL91 TaxID=2729538 RepID=UPI00145EFDB1|nr:chitobiase/beta-hexosaminidase C-terminal domain-containing protein [Paenibacillus sp. PL91]MBC9203066.1 chitobiase/beta-hexosaminidase C-terminal domain-containing protein [Paenibacillus sp. PL91]